MAEMRSKMRTVELTTVSAMRSTRSELEKAAADTASAWGESKAASSSRWAMVMGDSAMTEAMAQGSGMPWASSQARNNSSRSLRSRGLSGRMARLGEAATFWAGGGGPDW